MKIVLEFLTIWWIRSSEGSDANSSEATWVKLPATKGSRFSGVTKTALLSWFLTTVHHTAGFSAPGAAGTFPLGTSRTSGLQAEKLNQLRAPTSAVEQTRGCSVCTAQCNGCRPWVRRYSHSAPWNWRQKMFLLMSFSLYLISNNFLRTVHGEMSGCLLCCLDCWVFKSPYMQFLCAAFSASHLSLPKDSSLENLPCK